MMSKSQLPDYADALARALDSSKLLDRIESIDLHAAAGRVLAEPVSADRDLPPFNRAQMDGYALRHAEFQPGRTWQVVRSIAAGESPQVHVPAGQCVAIATGAALPEGLDVVIQHELSDRADCRGEPVQFNLQSVTRWQSVHRRGSDASRGDVLIQPGVRLKSQHLGIAAAVGCTSLRVRVRPRTAILSSGDEVVPPETSVHQLQQHQIRNSNAIMVAELVKSFGAAPAELQHLHDDRQATVRAVAKAISQHDLVITIGGVSAGDRDHFPAAFDAAGIKRSLSGASIQPGRPVQVGRAPNGSVVIALPGNPVSALACSCLFVWPVVRTLLGLNPQLAWRVVELAEDVKPNSTRRAFRPARLLEDDRVIVPRWAGSGDLAHTASADGLLELPVQEAPVSAGTRLRFLAWP